MLNLQLNLIRHSSNAEFRQNHTELVEKVTRETFDSIKAKFEVDGWILESWEVAEQPPYEEGQAAAASGVVSDYNPYAEHLWKHDEWLRGLDDYRKMVKDLTESVEVPAPFRWL